MELELKFAELACCEPVGDLVTTQEESMETAIPEYCPDIARIPVYTTSDFSSTYCFTKASVSSLYKEVIVFLLATVYAS